MFQEIKAGLSVHRSCSCIQFFFFFPLLLGDVPKVNPADYLQLFCLIFAAKALFSEESHFVMI
jgi:hypothetical protein